VGDPQNAADIAYALAICYQKEEEAELLNGLNEKLQTLRNTVETQRQLTEKMATELVEMQTRHGIADPDIEKPDASVTAPGKSFTLDQYRYKKQRYLSARREYEKATIHYAVESQQSGHWPTTRIWEVAEVPTAPLLPSYRRFKYALSRR
jgi:hypothetical protein